MGPAAPGLRVAPAAQVGGCGVRLGCVDRPCLCPRGRGSPASESRSGGCSWVS